MLTRAEADVMIAKIAAFMKKNDNAVGDPGRRCPTHRIHDRWVIAHNQKISRIADRVCDAAYLSPCE